MSIEDEIENYVEEMVESGALFADGVSPDGETIYVMDLEIVKEKHPLFYQEYINEEYTQFLDLSEQGLVTIDFLSGPELQYELTDKGRKYAEDIIAALNQT